MSEHSHPTQTLLVTGGAGFIGSNFCYYWHEQHPEDKIIILDALTYAGNRESLKGLEQSPQVSFVHGNITDEQIVDQLMADASIVVHFAAETHVDRSIKQPDLFLQSNVMGTHVLLRSAVKHQIKRFHHISTDEVFGTLSLNESTAFSESTPYAPRSPYAASKAASDHLVRAYAETYGLPITITNCSNNYGPFQFPEKLLPLAITNLMEGRPVPIYGQGNQIRDWLFVKDHCRAIESVLEHGAVGETYLVGGLSKDVTNLELIKMVLRLMRKDESNIAFVADRPGHDQKYRVDWSKIHRELDWKPEVSLEEGLQRTIDWYTQNQSWWKPLVEKNQEYFSSQYQTSNG